MLDSKASGEGPSGGKPGIGQRLATLLLNPVVRLRRSAFREKIPKPLRSLGYRLLPKRRLAEKMWWAEYEERIKSVRPGPIQTSVTLGIIKDYMLKHGRFEAACMELGVPYKLIDITSPDWVAAVEDSGCDAFLVWPSHIHSFSKRMFDERLRIMVEDLGKVIFPRLKSLWLYDSKRRVHDWLRIHDFPQPRTWVFFGREAAMAFVEKAHYPLVFKTDLGSSAHGVEIVLAKGRARRLVGLCFGRGYQPERSEHQDRQQGTVMFQQYLPDADEWRVMRVGDSYFGYQKLKEGDFHSGSHLVGWYTPPPELLDLCRRVTDAGPFLSMSLDVFETKDGRFWVNELHPVWGIEEPSEMYVDGRPGRFVYDEATCSWRFEEGVFNQNASCNLRIHALFELLGLPSPPAFDLSAKEARPAGSPSV